MIHHIYKILYNQIRVTVFDATFNNISVISWLYVLLVKETGVPIFLNSCKLSLISYLIRGRRGRDSIVVGFITTYAINAYRH
jgi:hypothetical protein